MPSNDVVPEASSVGPGSEPLPRGEELADAFGGAGNIVDADGSGRGLVIRVKHASKVSEHALAVLGFVGAMVEGDRFELLGPFDAMALEEALRGAMKAAETAEAERAAKTADGGPSHA